jgi:hypothetical protein
VQKRIGWLWVVAVLGFSAAAIAQTPPPSTGGTRFDGRYAFFSSTKLNETYTTRSGQMGQCADRIAGPLTIMKGQARYSGSGRMRSREFEGTVGSQGELAMRANVPAAGDSIIELTLYGRIDGKGTVTARQRGASCSYDFVWKKESK